MPKAPKTGSSFIAACALPDPENIGFRYPHQVSGGQLQRAMTAMAMSCRPDLIIFDEPTTALDVTTQIEVLASIREIVEEYNTAAIYITHDLAVVAQMADTDQSAAKRGRSRNSRYSHDAVIAPRKNIPSRYGLCVSFERPAKPAINIKCHPSGECPAISTAAYGKV